MGRLHCKMAMLHLSLILGFLACSAAFHGVTSNSSLKFKKLVLLSRHGIRTPYPASSLGLSSYRAFSRDNRVWPETPADWGAAGEEHLTDHGMKVLQLMGEYYRASLDFNASVASSTFYADVDASDRDLQTAQSFLHGMGFNAPVILQNKTCTTWLFNQGGAPPSSECGLPSEAQVQGTLGGDINRYTAQYKDTVLDLNAAIGCCTASVCGSEGCTLMDIPSKFDPAAFWSLYSGPLSTASTLTELLSLMYQNGMDTSVVAPGLDMHEISRLTGTHARQLRITDSDFITAQSFGSQLADHISRTVMQLASGVDDPSLLSDASNNFVYYAAHDINLYFLRALLRLQWQTESYNDNMAPPGSMLGFALFQDSTDQAWYLKIGLSTQSYDQMRFLSPLNATHPAGYAPVLIPECCSGPDLSCPVKDFQKLVAHVVKTECLKSLQC